MIIWLCFALPLLVSSKKKLTVEENESVKQICGEHYLGDKLKRKSFGGRDVYKNEYPWLVTIEWGGGSSCSGSLISPRHVLTAAHCYIRSQGILLEDEDCGQYGNKRQPIAAEENYIVFVGANCSSPAKCPNRIRVNRIHYHEAFNECSYRDDLAILELTEDVPSSLASPICLPMEHEKIQAHLKVAGSGDTGPKKYDSKQHRRVVKGKYVEDNINTIIVTFEPNVGTCSGDSGGPLFQEAKENRYTIIGVYSGGSSCWIDYNAAGKGVAYFTNVLKYLHWICGKSGVCPDNADVTKGNQ